jgi:LemA protein
MISIYNKFARLRQHIRESWSGIEVEMKRRYDLIPNLVATVQGYAKHERETLEQITKLRNTAMANHGTAASQATDECALMLGMKKFFALVENYPELKANEHFLPFKSSLP